MAFTAARRPRIVYSAGVKWASYRCGGQKTRWHGSQKEAIRHARRMLNDQGFGRLLIMEQADNDNARYRIVKEHVR